MDGSEVLIAVFGSKGVGKSTFIQNSLGHYERKCEAGDQFYITGSVSMCGRDVPVKIVEDPELTTRAILSVILFDLTSHETYMDLPQLLEMSHRVCPTAHVVVIGTKADLRKPHHVTTEEAEGFCAGYHNGKFPYYEISRGPSEAISALFKEVLARPLINDQVLRFDTPQENTLFVHETMEWALTNGSANVLTHLRQLGYEIPEDLIRQYDETVGAYLLVEYPLKALPKFSVLKRPEFSERGTVESELDEDDEPQSIIDTRATLHLTKTNLLQLSDISLTCIPSSFFQDLLPLRTITHVDLSHNLLNEAPVELFQLPSLVYLNLSHNSLTSLPSYAHWGHTHLRIIDVSYNRITGDALSSPSAHKKLGVASGSTFFPKLWSVDISHNDLNVCPKWVLLSRALMHLNLSGNNKIKSLPSELGLMTHMHSLLLNGLSLSDPPDPIPSLGTQPLLSYLHYKHKASQAIASLRVVVVGPESVGKTALVARLKGDGIEGINPTKGLEVSEWKYKGDVLRRNMVTFDLWDFTGSLRYKSVYSCFDCKDSLHLAVFDINTGFSEIIAWLSDIQSFSEERVPVILVFTHLDSCTTRESRETEKKSRTEWVKYNMAVSKKPETSPAFTLLASSMSQTVKSLQDIDGRGSVHERIQSTMDHLEFSGHIVPLMPFVITEPHFVSCTTNEGISQLRKTLYRIGVGSFRTTHPALLTIGIEVPTMYLQVEDLIRQLRGHLKTVKTEGELKPFHSFTDIRERLRRPLKQLDITASDFLTVLRFLHKRGVVYLHDSPREDDKNSPVIAIDPQIIGFLLQRTIRSGEMHGEGSILSGFLPNVHPAMIWGVDPVLFADDNSAGITGLQLIDFLTSIDLCAPLVPGAVLIPSLLPRLPPTGSVLNLEDLVPKRVYILGYLPSFFWCHLMSKILRSLAHHRFLQGDSLLTPSSPSSLPPRPANPLVTPTGACLYLWQKHFVFEDVDGSKLWVVVYEGGQLGPESTQYCGRVDVLVKASREKEALLLRIVTDEIEQLLSEKYPSLLDDCITPSLVDILVPLSSSWFTTDLLLSPPSSPGSVMGGGKREEEEDGQAIPLSYSSDSRGRSFSSIVDSTSLQSFSSIQGTLHEAFASVKATGTLPSSISSEEVIDSNPTGSLRLNPQASLGGGGAGEETQTQYLVPAWECLQESFKSPTQQLRGGRLDFQGLIPDILFADCPAQNLIMPLESHMISVKVHESKGMFLRHYFSEKLMEPAKRHKGAQKTFFLKSQITRLHRDFDLLKNLTSPYIISPVGLHYSVPVLALELSPHGSVRRHLNDGKELSQTGVHQIALQVLSAIKFLNTNGLNYHCITCDNVLLWLLEPVTIKLSDSGLLHSSSDCVLCSTLNTTCLTASMRKAKMFRFNLIMFGLFLYEITLHHRAYEGIIPLTTVILALYHQQLDLNVEAELKHIQAPIKACHGLCMQSVIQLCIGMGDLTFRNLESRLSLCAGENKWAPLKLTLDMEVLLTPPSPSPSHVFWASGSRGLVVGSIEPLNGTLDSKILAEAPTPESGLFANRRGKPIPIAVGHATAIDICTHMKQLWVGTENGLMGSVYVFKLPDFKSHHYIHLQDAVLSLKIMDYVSPTSSSPPPSTSSSSSSTYTQDDYDYRALVGLANGTIILFSGRNQGGVLLENPLQGPRRVITTFNRKPCLGISTSSDRHLWTACGDNFEVFEFPSMKSVGRHVCSHGNGGGGGSSSSKGEVIILSGLNRQGMWSVARRSSVLRLWDFKSGVLKSSFNVRNILKGEFNEITALVVRGHAVWLGTRSGYLFLLDASAIENQEQESAIKGFQYCGEGRVKGITPFPSSLKVLCSVEYPDEVSGCIMMWAYQSTSLKSYNHSLPTQSLQAASKYCIDSEFFGDS